MAEAAANQRFPAARLDLAELRKQVNEAVTAKLGARANGYLRNTYWPIVTLNEEAFGTLKEDEAERLVGESILALRPEFSGYFTKAQLRAGDTGKDPFGRKFINSYSANGGWWLIMQPPPFTDAYSQQKYKNDVDHGQPFSYDAHVPLLFFGFPFAPGIYRNHAEPVDLAVTLSSLLGINKPSHAVGRVLTEALAPEKSRPAPAAEPEKKVEKPQ
jgi:hypothetical protein